MKKMTEKNRVFVNMQENLEEPQWLGNVECFAQKVLEMLEFSHQEISILFCNDEYMQQLNKNYRGIDSSTDVLSFENDMEYEDEYGKWKCVGDIVISLETLPINSDYFDENNNDELKRLLVHGILHLNGMDHGDEHIEKGVMPVCEMLQRQEKILELLKEEKIIK